MRSTFKWFIVCRVETLSFDLRILSLQAELRHTEILGQLLHAAKIVAEREGILDGFRVVINNGAEACKFPSPYLCAFRPWLCNA